MRLGNDPLSQLALTPLERRVLQTLSERLGSSGFLLRAQCECLRVLNRSHSGVGFVTKLEVPGDVAGITEEEVSRIGAVYADHPQMAEPAEFLVQLKSGRLASIEAYCYEGIWPPDESLFRVRGP